MLDVGVAGDPGDAYRVELEAQDQVRDERPAEVVSRDLRRPRRVESCLVCRGHDALVADVVAVESCPGRGGEDQTVSSRESVSELLLPVVELLFDCR